jgi:hypothetical protein
MRVRSHAGLFAVSVLVKLSRGLNLWKIMETFILGQFVMEQVSHNANHVLT